MDEIIEEASKKYQGLVPLVYDIDTMGLDEARPQDMPYAVCGLNADGSSNFWAHCSEIPKEEW